MPRTCNVILLYRGNFCTANVPGGGGISEYDDVRGNLFGRIVSHGGPFDERSRADEGPRAVAVVPRRPRRLPSLTPD